MIDKKGKRKLRRICILQDDAKYLFLLIPNFFQVFFFQKSDTNPLDILKVIKAIVYILTDNWLLIDNLHTKISHQNFSHLSI